MHETKSHAFMSSAIWMAGGKSHVGTKRPEIKADGEAPPRRVTLKPFGLMPYTTTNAEFAEFTRATGHMTDAERLGWSFVFRGLLDDAQGTQHPDLPWWNAMDGAAWHTPLGPGSDWHQIADHPVVHVSYRDAIAYARWVGGRLPTEAEWEYAARGGPQEARYPWGEDEPSNERADMCNIWQGTFPTSNSCADGYYGTAPAASFPPNAAGFYNMAGNVWEWCADQFRIRSLSRDAKNRTAEAMRNNEQVLKGGSFLCHADYCWRYRIAARSGRQSDNSTSNCGFRVAFDGS
ncbi:formylglycine-generating enzyme family protein [uncultured Tateyamaria sp.]|uniref:formylglycine-generating enzyme family protein n=1 Tax=uncultured Tateyamaria sp. TaxID=455651 RepID=UPI0026116A13|nr:formylglycine-generating enzyme family protein [uncultured Tateyamaria sp.]